MSVNHSARSGGKIEVSFVLSEMTVYCVFSLESPHRGDSNGYTQYTMVNIRKKITLIIPNLQLWDYVLREEHGLSRIVTHSFLFAPESAYS